MRGWRASVATIAALMLGASGGMAQTSGLIRLTDRDDLFGWEAVGRVDLGRDGYCTGVLIAPDQVLTAAHCVYDRARQGIAPEIIRFRAGLRDGVVIAEAGVARYAVAPGYDPVAGMQAENIRRDVALLHLSTPISAALAAPFHLSDAPAPGQRVSLVSYGRDRDKAPSWQRDCGLLWRAEGVMGFDCAVINGSSGAPVFAKDGGRARILSLVSGGNWEGGESRAYGMDLPDLVARLKQDLRAAVSHPRAANPGFRRAPVGGGSAVSGAKFARP
ncbi:MAG: trypsin-like serine peptidase [Roseovarius sp.]